MTEDLGALSMDEKIWIFVKKNSAGQDVYRVHPSPRTVKKSGSLRIVNLTDYEATAQATDKEGKPLFDRPVKVPKKDKQDVTVNGAAGSHEYQVWVNGELAHGAFSDPDIIVDP
jgi:hypothetical protein